MIDHFPLFFFFLNKHFPHSFTKNIYKISPQYICNWSSYNSSFHYRHTKDDTEIEKVHFMKKWLMKDHKSSRWSWINLQCAEPIINQKFIMYRASENFNLYLYFRKNASMHCHDHESTMPQSSADFNIASPRIIECLVWTMRWLP